MKQTAKGITAFLFLICGCAKSEPQLNPDLAGTYLLQKIDGGSVDEGIGEEKILGLQELDLQCTLQLNEDGTAVMDIYGEQETFSWTNDELVYTESGEAVPFTADGTTLTVMDEETAQALIFTRAPEESEQE